MLDYKRYKISELNDFIQSDLFSNTPILPISEHRAKSYIENPRAVSDDIVMYVVFEANTIVAYRLVLPDYLFLKGRPLKVAWYSCLYVAKDRRGRGIGKKLATMALEDWYDHIVYHDPVTASGNLYNSTQRFDLYPGKAGLRCYLGFRLEEFLKSRRKFTALHRSARLLDFFIGKINLGIVGSRARKLSVDKMLKVKTIRKIDEQLARFIDNHQEGNWIKRGAEELNWIVNFPWIIESPNNPIAERYYFSAYDKQFSYQQRQFENEKGEIVGYTLTSIRNGQMKLLFSFFNKDYTKSILNEIVSMAIAEKCWTFTLYQEDFVELIQQGGYPFWSIKKKTRPLFVSKKLNALMEGETLVFQEGDSDNCFT